MLAFSFFLLAFATTPLQARSSATLPGQASAAPSVDADFVTAMAKGYAGGMQLKGGDARKAGALATLYSGPRPPHYNPMRKQGAIILGIGGDNSCSAVGTFYEGAMA